MKEEMLPGIEMRLPARWRIVAGDTPRKEKTVVQQNLGQGV